MYIFLLLGFLNAGHAADVLTHPELGTYSIAEPQGSNAIEVTQIGKYQNSQSPHLRIKVLRKNQRPLEINLRAQEVSNTSAHYSGQLGPWSESHMGVQLEFSFDKKTWKKLGRLIKKLSP